MKKFIAMLLAALTLACFSSCGRKGLTGYIVKYDISSPLRSIDPQVASSPESLMVIENTFEGLLRKEETGELAPGVATDYEVSQDGLTYTFTLRRDAMWSDGETPVTAHDFVFAFRRILDPATSSTGASSFLCIKNARDVLSGVRTVYALGVSAPDDYTFVIELDTPNPFLAESVTSAAAMPCNEAFFRETKGRYGLEPEYLLYNGPFLINLKSTDLQKRINLRVNEYYRSGKAPVAGGANLYLQSDDQPSKKNPDAVLQTADEKVWERFYSGQTDAASVTYEQMQSLRDAGKAEIHSFENKVWGLAFNCRTNTYGTKSIRRAFALALDPSEYSGYFTGNLSPAGAVVPSAVKLLDKPYREIAGEDLYPARDPALAKALIDEGLASLGVDKLSSTSILCPDTDGFTSAMSVVQKQLQQTLGVFVNLEPLPLAELESRVARGDYMIAVIPLTAGYNNPEAVLSAFSGMSSQNQTGFASEEFDSLLARALVAGGIVEAARLYEQAEHLLLSSAAFLPVAYETSYYACAQDVQDLVFSPFSYRVYFKYAYEGKPGEIEGQG